MQAKRRPKTGAASARRRISGDVWSLFCAAARREGRTLFQRVFREIDTILP